MTLQNLPHSLSSHNILRNNLFLLVIILTPVSIFSQNRSSDSHLETTNRLEHILEFCKNRSNSNEEIFVQANNGIQIAKTQNDTLYEVRFLFWKGRAESSMGKFEEAIEDFNKANDFYQRTNDTINIIKCLVEISNTFLRQSEYEKSKEYIEQAIELTDKIDAPSLEYTVKLTRSNIYYYQRDHPKTLFLYEEIIEFCHEHNLDSTYILLNRGTVLHNMGQSSVALDRLFQVRQSDNAQENQVFYAHIELHIGYILMEMGFYPEALEFYQRAYDFFIQKNDVNLLSSILENMGVLMLKQNQLEQAEKYLSEAINYKEKNGLKDKGDLLIYLGRVSFLKKDFEPAQDFFEKGLEIFTTLDDIKGKGDANNWIAKVLLELKDDEQALEYALKGLEISEGNKTAQKIADSYQILSEIYESQKQFDLALQASKKMDEYKKQFQQPENLIKISRKLVSETLIKNDIPVITKISESQFPIKNVIAILTGFILILGVIVYYFKSSNNKDSKNIITSLDSPKTQKKEYLKDAEAQKLLVQLNECIKTKRPYFNEELTLNGLATQVGTTDKKLSALLNQHINTSFYDYINLLRVEAFKKEIEKEENSTLSLIGIAFNCGFKSKSSFYRIFKKETGLSPSEYKKQFFSKK